MTNITLVTAVDKTVGVFGDERLIPKGEKGNLINIIIENGKVLFLLEFLALDTIEWYEVNEVEERF